MTTVDASFMRQTIELARSHLGATAPNPSVGALLVREGEIIGRGVTASGGIPHAEVLAIRDCVEAEGATLYVTLEPCCHHGRTPPCTDAILAAGVARVVVGTIDPYPHVNGHGVHLLREAGVEVEVGVEEEACKELVRGFGRSQRFGLPEVTCKAAVSLDGKIATHGGESKWITGEASRRLAHELRASHDAILVGIETVLHDDPRLTCRVPGGQDPVPVILDTGLRTPEDARLFASTRTPLILCAADAPQRSLPATVVRIPRDSRGLDIVAAFAAISDAGLHRVLVEGGGHVHRSVLEARLADRLVLMVAPMLIPGGRGWIGGEPLAQLSEALRLPAGPSVQKIGDDLLLDYALEHFTNGAAS